MTVETALAAAEELGFSHFGELNVGALEFLPDVRKMCEANRCGAYKKSWVCPPACGTLEEITEKAKTCSRGILVQTTGQLEDDFDYEGMVEAEKLHKEHFTALVLRLRAEEPDLLPMAAGSCTICRPCAYPDKPCRFPEKAFTSMEAYGLFVSDVCAKSGLGYYYGRGTVTYTSCILLK